VTQIEKGKRLVTEPLDLVVSADWLAAHAGDPNLVIVDVRPLDQYEAGHIPGARGIDLYPYKILTSDPDRIESWVASIQAAFRQLGIANGDRVVFYEDSGGTTAARGVWVMHALSIGEGAMLDGGLMAWMAAGHPISREPVEIEPSELTVRLNPDLFATADDVLAAAERDDTVIVDTRADLEWMQGTIPAARHLEWIHHLNPDGTFRSREELRAMYEQLGADRDDEVIAFCGSGYRAAHTWLVLTMLGYTNARNYAPSWGEWGRRDDLPIVPTR
jgi:thiosulfate/3-mercaptopyruvate sulfurtransferase